MQFLRHSLIGLFLLSLTLGILAYAGSTVFTAVQDRISNQPNVPERREREFAVNTILAKEQTLAPVLTAFGEVESRRVLEVRAKTSGTLIQLSGEFEEGGDVTGGQLLAQIDPADAQAVLDRASSDLLDAQAETREADRALALAQDELAAGRDQAELRERAFRRQVNLEDRGVGTAASVELAELAAAQARQAVLANRQALAQAEARVDQAATRLNRAKIALAEAQRRLDDTTITAGFSGTLADVTVVTGGVVTANERLATLIDADALEVAFRISTAQYARLLNEDGALLEAPVTVMMDAFGLELAATGVITRDSAAVGEGQTGRVLFASLDKANGLKPGDFVTVLIEEPEMEGVVLLPASALSADGQVLVIDDQARLKGVPVILLRRQGDDVLVRGQGLAGQKVVAQRTPLLGEGIKVQVLDDPDTTQEEASLMLELSEDRRARLIAYVEANTEMPDEAKSKTLAALSQARVPAQMVRRLETRMGG